MKKSLVISDSEKYGKSSPEVALSPSDKKPEDRKSAPTIELTGKQVDAFCACSLAVGDKGTATVHYVVKAASAGDHYGNEVPNKKSQQRVTLSITHVEADGKPGDSDGASEDEEEAGEDPAEEKAETPDEEAAEESSEDSSEESASEDNGTGEETMKSELPKKGNKAPVKVKDSGLDDL